VRGCTSPSGPSTRGSRSASGAAAGATWRPITVEHRGLATAISSRQVGRLGTSRQCVNYEQARGLAAMVAPAVRRRGRKPKRLPRRDPHFRGAVLELVSNLAVENVARVRAVAPLGPSGSRRVLDKRPADTVDDLLDITDVRVVLRWGSVEGHHARRGRIRAHSRPSLRDPLWPGPGFCSWSASCLSGSPWGKFSCGRVSRTPRGVRLPSAPDVPVSEHPAQASPAATPPTVTGFVAGRRRTGRRSPTSLKDRRFHGGCSWMQKRGDRSVALLLVLKVSVCRRRCRILGARHESGPGLG